MRPVLNNTLTGEADYILLKSGLVAVRGSTVEPTQDLIALFCDAPVPPMAELEPVLIQVAEVTAYGLGGAITVFKHRVRAVDAARSLGLTYTDGAISELFARVRVGLRRRKTSETSRRSGRFERSQLLSQPESTPPLAHARLCEKMSRASESGLPGTGTDIPGLSATPSEIPDP